MHATAAAIMQEAHEQDSQEVEISDLDGRESSTAAQRLNPTGNLVKRLLCRSGVLGTCSTIALMLILVLLVLRTEIMVPARTQVSLYTPPFLPLAVLAIPGETLVVSSDGTLSALHQDTDRVIWQVKGSGVWGVPLVSQGTIFVTMQGGSVSALQATTGKVLWHYYRRSSSASILQVGTGLVFVRDQSVRTPEGAVVALRTRDGALLWQRPVYSLAGFVRDDNLAYITTAGGLITAVHLGDGTPVWAEHTRVSNWVTTADNLLFVATYDGTVTAVHPDSGTPLWQRQMRVRAMGVPLISGGNVFVPTADDSVNVLDALTGAPRWHARADPLVVTSGLVYSLTNDGRMTVLRANSGTLFKGYQGIESVLPIEVRGEIFAVTAKGVLLALRAQHGTVLWSYRLPSPLVALNPAGVLVYVSTRNDGVVALQVSNGSVLWTVGSL